MKLLKLILKIILILVLIIITGGAIFLIIVSDSSTPEYKPSDTPTNLESLLGKSLYDSLDSISTINKEDLATSENNKITVDLTYQDLNDCVTSFIRESSTLNNGTYLKDGGTTSIASAGVVAFDTLTFQEVNNKFGAVARGSAFGFYKTSIYMELSEDPSIVDNVLYLKLGGVKLGNKVGISADFVKGIFNRFSLFNDSKNEYFDIKDLTMHLDLNQQIENFTSSTRFTDFLAGATYSASYTAGENAHLSLDIDTKNIFTNYEAIPTSSTFTLSPSILSLGGTVTLTEENFNYLIQKEFDKKMSLEPMSLGGYDFNFELNNFYYDIDAENKSNVLAEVAINNLKTKVTASINETITKKSDAVENVILSVDTLKIGNVVVPNDNFFNEIVIDSDTLTQGHSNILKVENIVFDHTNGEVKITYGLNI